MAKLLKRRVNLSPLSTFKKQRSKDRGCSNCGSKTHVSYRDLKKEDRNISPTHGKTYHKCGKANHFEAVYRTKVVGTDTKPEAGHGWILLFTIGTGRDAHVTNVKE